MQVGLEIIRNLNIQTCGKYLLSLKLWDIYFSTLKYIPLTEIFFPLSIKI